MKKKFRSGPCIMVSFLLGMLLSANSLMHSPMENPAYDGGVFAFVGSLVAMALLREQDWSAGTAVYGACLSGLAFYVSFLCFAVFCAFTK